MKKSLKHSAQFRTVGACLLFSILSFGAHASMFWDPTGTTLNTTANGSWEGNVWATNGVPTNGPIGFVEGSFVVFSVTGEGATAITCTANADHTFAGIFNGGTGGATTCANLIINGTGILSFSGVQGLSTSSGGLTTINNVLAGTGTLQNGSSGQLFLNGVNTFSGGVNVAATGLINFNNTSSFGTGPINWNSGGSGGAFVVEGSSAITIPNNFVVNAAYSYNLVGNTAGVTYSGNWNLGANTISLGSGGSTANVNILSGVISGTGGVGRQSQSTAGIIKLTGANTYTGKSSFQSGVTIVSSLNSVASPSQQTSSNLGKPSNAANGTLGMGATTFTGTLQYIGAGETTDRVIDLAGTTGGGVIDQSGTGLLKFTSGATATSVSSKSLTLQGSTAGSGEISGVIANNPTIGSTVTTASFAIGATSITLASVDGIVVGASISGTGIAAGTTVSAINTGTRVVTLSTAATGAGTSGQTITVAGVVNLTSVTKSGTGTWTLSAPNTYSGNTLLNTAGKLNLAHQFALGFSKFVINQNGLFDNTSGADMTITNTFTLSGGSPTYVGSANDMTITGPVTISAANRTITVSARTLTLTSVINQDQQRNFTKAGTGTLVLAGGSAHTGSLIINGGTLTIGGAGQLDGGTYIQTIINTNGGTFTYSSSAAQTLSGVISGTGALIQNGPGTLTLSAVNTYSGPTTAAAGTLDVSASGALTVSPVTVASGATLKLDSNTALGSTVNLLLNSGSPVVNLNYAGTDQIQLLSFDGGATFAPGGTYGAIGSGAAFEDARFTGTGLLAVLSPSTASVTPSANPATYGDTVTLTASVSGAGPTPTGTVTFKEGATTLGTQTLDGTGSAAISTNGFSAASHSITVVYSGDVNYGPSTSPAVALVVNKAPLSITANDQSKVYGQTVSFGSGSTAFSSVGLKFSETIGTVTLASPGGVATAPVSGSPYAITPSAATGGTFNPNNYAITYNTGNLTVTPAALTVTATALLVYGFDPTNAIYVPHYATLQGTDTVAVITGSADFSTDATSSNYVGSNYLAHVVDTGTLSSPNYIFAAGPDGVLTITNRPLAVTNVVANNKVYDGTTSATLDFTGAGLDSLVNGDAVTLVSAGATGTFANRNVGTNKTVTVSGLSISGDLGTNYFLIQPTTTTANITELAVTVTAVTDTKVYDGTTTSAGIPLPTPALASGDTGNFSQTFDNKNAGTGKILTPSGSITDGNGGANYALTFVPVSNGAINPKPITVTAVTDTKVYDGSTASIGIPSISPALIGGDTANFSQSFSDKNVGTSKTLVPTGSVNDGNTGANYAVTFVNDTTGVITAKAITVTAITDSKVYDGTTSSAVVPTIAPGLAAGDIAGFSETFDTRNVGAAKTLTPAGSVNDGNAGANYSVTFVSDSTGVITQMPITVTAVATTKIYDGTTSSSGDPTIAPFLAVGDISSFIQTYDNKNVGTGKTLTPSGTVLDGNGGANYSITFLNNSNGVITWLTTTNLLVSSENPSAFGSNVTLTATVNGNPPAADLPTGEIIFFTATGPFSTNTLVNGSCSASISSLPVGTNTITATYFGDNNFNQSSGTIDQVVTNSITYSTTNIILSIANNNNGTVTLNLLGTPGAQYYIVSSSDISLPLSGWPPLGGSTNTASNPNGLWSHLVGVSNALPVYFRSAAINPAP